MIFGILASFFQVVVYYLLILILWNIGKKFHTPIKTDYTWGLTILYSTYVFGIISLIQNSLIEILDKKNIKIYFFIGAIISFTLIVQNFNYWPIKTLMLIISGLISLLLKFIFDLNYKNLKSKIVNLQSKIQCLYE